MNSWLELMPRCRTISVFVGPLGPLCPFLSGANFGASGRSPQCDSSSTIILYGTSVPGTGAVHHIRVGQLFMWRSRQESKPAILCLEATPSLGIGTANR